MAYRDSFFDKEDEHLCIVQVFGISIFSTFSAILWLRPLQFNYLSYELFLEKKSCQTQKKKKKKAPLVSSFKNILCKGDSINYRKLSLL